VRLITEAGNSPVVWPSVIENRTYHYERVSSDPQCGQQILLTSNEYGQPLRQVSVSYPRRQPLSLRVARNRNPSDSQSAQISAHINCK